MATYVQGRVQLWRQNSPASRSLHSHLQGTTSLWAIETARVLHLCSRKDVHICAIAAYHYAKRGQPVPSAALSWTCVVICSIQ